MVPRLTKRRLLLALLLLATPLVVFLFIQWRKASLRGGQQPAEPFRIAGNLYYVGANDVTSFLLTGPEGHVLIDGGYPGTASMIMASIARLGFDIKDVKVLLNTEPHFDHAGGLAELQRASGAELWASEYSAKALESGGGGEGTPALLKFLVAIGISRYPSARVDHRFADRDTIRLGPIELIAHITAGHTRGCTSWEIPLRDGDRELRAVHVCSLTFLGGPMAYPGYREDFDSSFARLRSLPADLWVTTHARNFGRYRKFVARDSAADPVAPFIDRDGYFAHLDSAEARLRRDLSDR